MNSVDATLHARTVNSSQTPHCSRTLQPFGVTRNPLAAELLVPEDASKTRTRCFDDASAWAVAKPAKPEHAVNTCTLAPTVQNG